MNSLSRTNARPLLTISLSGAPSAGKSTLLYLLTALLSPLFVLQLDDFCKEDIPLGPHGTLDADCPDAIDFPAFMEALKSCKSTGKMPVGFQSWQDEGDIQRAREMAMASVRGEVIEEMRKVWEQIDRKGKMAIGIVDGFLLYHSTDIRKNLDIKLFLRVSKAAAFKRRMSRPGYGDPDNSDFWRAPVYFEECVWRNYVKENSWLFESGDIEGRPDEDACKKEGILMQPGVDWNVEDTFQWAVREVVEVMKGFDGNPYSQECTT